MPRHFLSDADVQPLVQDLIALVLHEGSVNAAQNILAATLAEDKSEGWLYPNRLHSLLSAEPARAINTDTLTVLKLALSRLPDDALDLEKARFKSAQLRSEARVAWESAASSASDLVDTQARLRRASAILNLPPAVTQWLLVERVHHITPQSLVPQDVPNTLVAPPAKGPDWSFQDTAWERCLTSLQGATDKKVGLVIPTGGGKTRVAIRVALSMLGTSNEDDSVVLWVTHRTRLKTQAHRELQRAITEGTPELPEDAARLLGDRVHFCMIADLPNRLQDHQSPLCLVIVDEAHHAAASSYKPLFDYQPLRGLFLTATPNRTDLLPIGIDEVAYTITYRELFARGVIIEPAFEAVDLFDFDWDEEKDVTNLADLLLARAEHEFVNTLVAVTTVDHAIKLHRVLESVLEEGGSGGVLDLDDLGYVHGGGSSTGVAPEAFLDDFASRPRGIAVATAQLLGEGFDDPSINTVVVTYPTGSMLQLMQVAGRCLRYAPGKRAAYIVQMRESPLAYHYEQRWLYQDISDALLPQLVDREYSSIYDLSSQIEEILNHAHVRPQTTSAVRAALGHVRPGEQVALLMTGLPYASRPEDFDDLAPWHAVAVTSATRDAFLRIFNEFSSRGADVNDFDDYLRNFIQPDPAPSGQWKQYKDMLWGMSYAHREITGETYDASDARPYDPAIGTTWLRYITFRYEPGMPSVVTTFLADAINRDEIAAEYLGGRQNFALMVKVPLPLAGSLAFLLDEAQAEWLSSERANLRARLEDTSRQPLGVLTDWRYSLPSAPLPPLLVDQFDRFLRTDSLATLTLVLDIQ